MATIAAQRIDGTAVGHGQQPGRCATALGVKARSLTPHLEDVFDSYSLSKIYVCLRLHQGLNLQDPTEDILEA